METVISRKYCLNLLHTLHSSIPRSWTSHIYYYFQNIKKKQDNSHLGHSSVKTYSVLTVLSWLITGQCLNSGKKHPSLVYVSKLSCFLSAPLVPISHFSTGKATISSFIAIAASNISGTRSLLLRVYYIAIIIKRTKENPQ